MPGKVTHYLRLRAVKQPPESVREAQESISDAAWTNWRPMDVEHFEVAAAQSLARSVLEPGPLWLERCSSLDRWSARTQAFSCLDESVKGEPQFKKHLLFQIP